MMMGGARLRPDGTDRATHPTAIRFFLAKLFFHPKKKRLIFEWGEDIL
jgi:hypothetical protein